MQVVFEYIIDFLYSRTEFLSDRFFWFTAHFTRLLVASYLPAKVRAKLGSLSPVPKHEEIFL